VKAAAPGANITDILVTLESKYRMVVAAFNNTSLYRKLYWAGIGYNPGAAAAGRRSRFHAFLSRQWLAGEQDGLQLHSSTSSLASLSVACVTGSQALLQCFMPVH
jgi:hypothetical protein